jgi:hypothetical protein
LIWQLRARGGVEKGRGRLKIKGITSEKAGKEFAAKLKLNAELRAVFEFAAKGKG